MTSNLRRYTTRNATTLLLTLFMGAAAIPSAAAADLQNTLETPPQLKLPVVELRRARFGIPAIDDALHAADLNTHAGRTDAALEGYRQAFDLLRTYPSASAVARADALNVFGGLREKRNDIAGAIEAYREGVVDLQGEKDSGPHLIALESALTQAYLHQGRVVEAEDSARSAYQAASAYYGDTDQNTVGFEANLVESLYSQKNYAKAIPQATDLVKTATSALGADHWLVARAAAILGMSESGIGHRAEAIVDLGHAISLWNNGTVVLASDATAARNELEANIGFLELSQSASATSDLQRAFNQCADAHYVLATALAGTALGRREFNHHHERNAERAYLRTLPWAKQLDLHAETTLLYALSGLGAAEYVQKNLRSAETHFRRGLQLAREEGKSPLLLGSYLDNLSLVLASEGHYAEAFPYAEEMVDVYSRLPVPPITLAVQIERAALIYIAGQDRTKGLELLQRALALEEPLSSPGSGDLTATSIYWIALEAALLNQREIAEQYAKRALQARIACCEQLTTDISDDELLLGQLVSVTGTGNDAQAKDLFDKALHTREAAGTPDTEAEMYRALFLQRRHHPQEAQAALDRIPAWSDTLQDQFTFTTAADLHRHEVLQFWKQEALSYCATVSAADPIPAFCQRISPKRSLPVRTRFVPGKTTNSSNTG